jgi:hypothetical protein
VRPACVGEADKGGNSKAKFLVSCKVKVTSKTGVETIKFNDKPAHDDGKGSAVDVETNTGRIKCTSDLRKAIIKAMPNIETTQEFIDMFGGGENAQPSISGLLRLDERRVAGFKPSSFTPAPIEVVDVVLKPK